MKIRVPSLALFLTILVGGVPGCEINIDPPEDENGGSDTDNDDDDDDGSEGDSMLSGSGTGGAMDSGPQLPTAGGDDESGGDESSGAADSTGGDPASSACDSYCEAELACDDFYGSVGECLQVCEQERAESGDCGPAFDEVNECLGSLSCDEAFEFWVALSTIESGQDPGEFPCAGEFFDYASCLDADSGGGA